MCRVFHHIVSLSKCLMKKLLSRMQLGGQKQICDVKSKIIMNIFLIV